MYYVYSLKCTKGFYVGCTSNLKERLSRHRNGKVKATIKRLPIKLEFYIVVDNKYTAFKLEKYLKSGSGRSFVKRHFSICFQK